MERYVEVASLRSLLAEDGTFKKSVLDELEDKIDLTLAARMYVECLSSIHHDIRAMLDEPTRTSRREIEVVHERFANPDPTTAVTLSAVAVSSEREEVVPLLLTWDDSRQYLVRRNRRLVNLHKSYVTGRLRTKSTKE